MPGGPKRRAAFTLVELLVVIGIISVLVTIILPSVMRVQVLTRRMACATNVGEIVKACIGYATSGRMNRGGLPNAIPNNGPTQDNWWKLTDGDGDRIPDGNAGGLWLLVYRKFTSVKVFTCPEAEVRRGFRAPTDTGFLPDPPEPEDGGQVCRYSYSYLSQVPFVDEGTTYHATSYQEGTQLLILADQNPYCDPNALDDGSNPWPAATPESNSLNHDKEGQNIGRLDQSVRFIKTPNVPAMGETSGEENIYLALQVSDRSDGRRSLKADIFLVP